MTPTVFTHHKTPQVTLVGAGPGDPDLITLKAVKAIQQADVVLFDALVSPEILALIPTGVPALSVGKRAGAHSYTQDAINELIVECAYLYGHVVRLKGGDPFVFGRGSEEIDFAQAHGVATRVIPGISSAIAVPASLNIPVTARGMSESFWVVTGTTQSGAMSQDIALAAQSTATVVVLMGLNKIQDIMDAFSQHGKATVPVAVIQNGTLAHQRSVVGTVATIAALAEEQGIGAPAVMVIGEVVRQAKAVDHILARVPGQVASYQ